MLILTHSRTGCIPAPTVDGQVDVFRELHRNGSCDGCPVQLLALSWTVYQSFVSALPESEF